jgi:protease IV
MRLKWVGLTVIALVLITSFACIGGIALIAIMSSDAPSGDHVAVVEIRGPIVDRAPGGLFATEAASADRIVNELERVRESGSAQALILDIDSPGGAVTPTDRIYSELLDVKAEGIPVVAYFRGTAASGGYYIAAAADTIVSNPGTITGSIGVITQVPNLEELYDKLGIEMQIIQTGEFKDMMQPSRPLTDEEREIISEIQQETFESFISVIVTGRGMSEGEVRDLADGRIFSGRQAFENGLVDELGDFDTATAIAGELSGLGDDPELRDYSPSAPGFWDVFFGVAGREFDLSWTSLFDIDIDPRETHLEMFYGAR